VTLQERVVFINKVKGKKIYNKWWKRVSSQSDRAYFIPNGKVYKIDPFATCHCMEGTLVIVDGTKHELNFYIDAGFSEWEILPEDNENTFVQFSDPGIDTHNSPFIGPKSLNITKSCPHTEWNEVPGFMPGKVYKNCKSCGIPWEKK
jgi:hypothetical protein